MRVVFMGTPDFAACSLQKLIDEKYDVVGVFTQPDKPRGRGMEVSFSPVKEIAVKYDIPVYQPEKMRDGTALAILKELNPDVIAVVAYGRLLPDDILELPRLGCINVHGSLLPAYRGSAPIQWAVLNGDKITGVSTMYMATEMDAGDILLTSETEIGEFETSGELFDRLMVMGADLLHETLAALESGNVERKPQNPAEVTFAPRLEKTMCPIDFARSPRQVIKHIYGMQPWPVATAEIDGGSFRIFAAEYTETKTDKAPGEIVSAGKKGIEIACLGGETVMITELQANGKKRMKAADFLLGHPIKVQ
ncbi:MAG: methionyl-tRNA formyltransferase [Oscillospiraceae bacterium]|nr:methionyl-tRNA formyltransferase [Oscillospiraceae bacterium]